jgi:hypothetical protein
MMIRNVDGHTWTSGSTDVEVVVQTLVSGYPTNPSPNEWPNLRYTADVRTVVLPGGPYHLTLRLRRITSETHIALPDDGVDHLALLQEGKALVGTSSDGTINITSVREPSQILLLTLTTAPDGNGTPIAGNPEVVASPVP